MSETILGWHFCAEDKRLGYGDGRLIIEGETLRVEGDPELCAHGLHSSERLIDALKYAPGPILCRVELSDGIVRGDDKAVARERKTLWMFDATNALRDFAATVAENALLAERAAGREPDPRSLAVVQAVRDMLAGKIGKEELAAARDAARDAARAAASADASAAAWDAASAAAWADAWAAARAAALADAWDAALDAQNILLLQIIEKWRTA